MTLYDRLNLIGVTLTDEQRDAASQLAVVLRTFAATKYEARPVGRTGIAIVAEPYDDELGELADMLDTLAGPIVVQR